MDKDSWKKDRELTKAKLEVSALEHKVRALEWFNRDKDRQLEELHVSSDLSVSQGVGLVNSKREVEEQVLAKIRGDNLLWPDTRQTIVNFVTDAEVDIYGKHDISVRSLESICLELRVNMAKQKPVHSRDYYYRVARCRLPLALYSETTGTPANTEEEVE